MKSVGMDGNGCTFRPHAGLYHPTATLCGRHKLYALTMTMMTTYSQCFGVVLLPRLKCETTTVGVRRKEYQIPHNFLIGVAKISPGSVIVSPLANYASN